MEVQEEVLDDEDVHDSDNSSSIVHTVLNTTNSNFQYDCLDETVSLLNDHQIGQSQADRVLGNEYSTQELPGTTFLADQIIAIWFILSTWVSDSDKPGVLVADAMGLGKIFTTLAAAQNCKLLTKWDGIRLQQSIVCGNTLEEWINMVQNNSP